MNKTNIKLLILLFTSSIFLSIGYASIDSISLDISGTATTTQQEGMFISNIE